eukprot:TRINITY_DN34638_c0_g1_i1.p1 TRINITY_DN34638_c0_g1~~TRINITY_DN34638_c0_g1_i1.p1  ORF type:complete len:561 (+),score=62.92 TRINITY_DN34638_c0_g1_i1:91-1683(+)
MAGPPRQKVAVVQEMQGDKSFASAVSKGRRPPLPRSQAASPRSIEEHGQPVDGMGSREGREKQQEKRRNVRVSPSQRGRDSDSRTSCRAPQLPDEGNTRSRSSSAQPCGEVIVVHEDDFRRHQGDLESLRKVQLPKFKASPKKQVMSHREKYELSCRSQVELRDPWCGMPNPERRREKYENDLTLNQVWVTSPQKVETDRQYFEGLPKTEWPSVFADDTPYVPVSTEEQRINSTKAKLRAWLERTAPKKDTGSGAEPGTARVRKSRSVVQPQSSSSVTSISAGTSARAASLCSHDRGQTSNTCSVNIGQPSSGEGSSEKRGFGRTNVTCHSVSEAQGEGFRDPSTGRGGLGARCCSRERPPQGGSSNAAERPPLPPDPPQRSSRLLPSVHLSQRNRSLSPAAPSDVDSVAGRSFAKSSVAETQVLPSLVAVDGSAEAARGMQSQPSRTSSRGVSGGRSGTPTSSIRVRSKSPRFFPEVDVASSRRVVDKEATDQRWQRGGPTPTPRERPKSEAFAAKGETLDKHRERPWL